MAYYTLLTTIGAAKLANAQVTGVPLQLTEIAVGDGLAGAAYEPSEAQTELKNEVWRAAINATYVHADNANWMVIEGVVPEASGGWYVREVGIFDADGDLFAIGKYPDTYKPALAEGSAKDLYIRMILEISNTAAVTLKIDPAIVLATRKYVDDEIGIHDIDPDAHSATMMKLGKHEYYIPVDYMKPRVTSPCGDIATLETGVNKGNFRYRAFDPSVAEYAQYPLALPKSWDGATIEFKYKWSHPATTVNFGVAFALQAMSIGDNDALDAAFGAAVTVADVGGTTDNRYWSDWSAPVTIAGAGLGEDQTFQIFRNVGDAGNTLAVDARLEGIRLRVNFDKGNDE